MAPSQGAWVASALSETAGGIAFMVVMSGGGVSPRESERWAYRQALARGGFGGDAEEVALDLVDAYFRYLATGDARAELASRLDAVSSEPWYPHVNLGRIVVSAENRPNWEWVATYDPMPAIAAMTFPLLLLFGENDEQQPTGTAVGRWTEGLIRAGNERFTVRVFPDANHWLATGGHHGGAPAMEVLALVTGWVHDTVSSSAGR